MGILSTLFRRPGAEATNRDPSNDFWFGNVSRPTASAQIVTPDTAIRHPVVWDCLNVLSDSGAALPLHFFVKARNGARTSIDRLALIRFLQDGYEFRKQMLWDLARDGNFLALRLDRNGAVAETGIPDSLEWIPPGEYVVQRAPNGVVRYKVHESGGSNRVFVEGEVWHIKRPPFQHRGLIGTSTIEIGREVIGAALAVQDYGARFFANDCTPPFVIEHPSHFADPTSRKNFMDALKRWWGGSRRHSPGILEYGMKLSRVGVNNNEAQFLETRKELGYDIARMWRMPPHKVGMLERATNNNIEHQSLEFVMDTLLPWLVMIEKSLRRDILFSLPDVYAEHNVAGLLRGDLKGRYESYARARQWGWLSVNDIRELENLDPIAGGDVYLQPMNMVPAGQFEAEPDRQVLGADGRPVSKLFGKTWSRAARAPEQFRFENVINIEDHRDAA